MLTNLYQMTVSEECLQFFGLALPLRYGTDAQC